MTIDGHADAAGGPKTRRSTTGGSLRIGGHTLATWSSTQKVVSLSSAESEYNGVVRCASEAIGLANTLRELGYEAHVRISTGAAAARGLAHALRCGSKERNPWLSATESCESDKTENEEGKPFRALPRLPPEVHNMTDTRLLDRIIREQVSDGPSDQARLLILNWNAEPKRDKVANSVVGLCHVILLQGEESHRSESTMIEVPEISSLESVETAKIPFKSEVLSGCVKRVRLSN